MAEISPFFFPALLFFSFFSSFLFPSHFFPSSSSFSFFSFLFLLQSQQKSNSMCVFLVGWKKNWKIKIKIKTTKNDKKKKMAISKKKEHRPGVFWELKEEGVGWVVA